MNDDATQRSAHTHLIVRALLQLMRCEGPQGAAAISYFSLFSIFPLLLVLLAFTDQVLFIFGAKDAVMKSLMQLLPGARRFLQEKVMEMGEPSGQLFITCLFLFLWSASWMFDFMESAMNRAWNVTRRRGFLHSRMLAFWVILLSAFLFLLSTTVSVIVTQVAKQAEASPSADFFTPMLISLFWQVVLVVSSFLMTLLVFVLLFKTVPYIHVRLRDAFRGALLASVLWQMANYLFAYLVPYFNYQRVYGSISAVVALLTWVYLSSMIILWGNHYAALLQQRADARRLAGHTEPRTTGGFLAAEATRPDVKP